MTNYNRDNLYDEFLQSGLTKTAFARVKRINENDFMMILKAVKSC